MTRPIPPSGSSSATWRGIHTSGRTTASVPSLFRPTGRSRPSYASAVDARWVTPMTCSVTSTPTTGHSSEMRKGRLLMGKQHTSDACGSCHGQLIVTVTSYHRTHSTTRYVPCSRCPDGVLRQLRDEGHNIAGLERGLTAARERRDKLISRAIRLGVTERTIAQDAGVSNVRVHQIKTEETFRRAPTTIGAVSSPSRDKAEPK